MFSSWEPIEFSLCRIQELQINVISMVCFYHYDEHLMGLEDFLELFFDVFFPCILFCLNFLLWLFWGFFLALPFLGGFLLPLSSDSSIKLIISAILFLSSR